MAFTKAQLEALKNTLLAPQQPITALQHQVLVQGLIDEMYDAQSRANILVGVQADSVTGGSDTFLVFRSGQAYQLPLSLLNANSLENLGDVFISNLEDGDTLVYNAVQERWENQNIFLGFAISNLDDVELTSLANGDILRYDSVSEKWENESLANILAPYALLTDLDNYQLLSQKGQANGYAQLDSGAKIPTSIIPDSVLGQVEYKGTWNADTNTPTLPTTPDKKGDYYVVSEAGTFVGIDFEVGDWIISNGTAWEKVNNTDAVRTVFGRLGDIVANSGDYQAFYVNFDTAQTITGEKTFDSTIRANDGVRLAQIGGASSTRLVNLSSTFITSIGTNQFGFNSSNNIYFAGNNKFGGQLAWNNTANRTYTLQNASGTIAFTSDITNALGDYVTLNTNQAITGAKTFDNIKVSTSRGLQFDSQAGFNVPELNVSSIVNISEAFTFNFGFGSNNYKSFRLSSNLLSNNVTRSFSLPDSNGTLALTSDITNALGDYVTLNTNQAITGEKTFSTQSLRLAQASGAKTTIISNSSGIATTSNNFNLFGFNNSNNIYFSKTSDNAGVLAFTNTATRTYTLKDADGTLAFTSDIPANIVTGQGVAGRVAFWNGTGSISSDAGLFWNNTDKILNVLSPSFNTVIHRAGGDQANLLRFFSTNDVNPRHELAFGNGGVGDYTNSFRITVNFLERWRITSAGILQSNGAQTIQTSTGALTLQGNGGNTILNPTSGNVGIGTTDPQTILHINKFNTTAPTSGTTPSGYGLSFGTNNGANGGIWFSSVLGGDHGIAGISGIRTAGYDTELRFYTNNTNSARAFSERMRITSAGNVGIGETNPGARLHIKGVGVGAALDIENTTASVGRRYRCVSLNTGGFAVEDVTASAERMRITSTGNVLIGTTSELSGGGRLQVSGDGRFTGDVIAKKFISTETGNINMTSGEAFFVFDLTTLAKGTYLVNAVNTESTGNIAGLALIHIANTSRTLSTLGTSVGLSYALSGSDLTATQTTGSTRAVKFFITALSNL